MLTLYVMLTGNLFALRLLWAMNFMMLLTLNPFFKMDGYWLLSDLSGLSNLHQQVRDTIIRAGRKLFRRPLGRMPAPPPQGVLLKVLYVYIALAAAYFAYVIQFLYQSANYVVNSYPQRAGYLFGMITRTYLAGHTEVAFQYAMRLVYESVWPLLLSLLVCFMAFRVVRFLGRTIKSVMSGYIFTISLPRWSYIVAMLKARGARHG